MYRVFFPELQEAEQSFFIAEREEFHHLKNVLRAKPGDQIEIFDGKGLISLAEISEIVSKKIKVRVIQSRQEEPDFPQIILACAIPKKSKFEWIIEKATELGVHELIPLQTKRTEVVIPQNRLEKKMERFRSVMLSACKQSKRSYLMKTQSPMTLEKAIDSFKEKAHLLMPSLMGETHSLKDVCSDMKVEQPIVVFIGPEGDFMSDEYAFAHKNGCLPISLGKRILRVETAAFATISYLKFFHQTRNL